MFGSEYVFNVLDPDKFFSVLDQDKGCKIFLDPDMFYSVLDPDIFFSVLDSDKGCVCIRICFQCVGSG